MIIGSHVSFNSKGLLGSVEEALSYGANTFMFYTGAPQNTRRKDIDNDIVDKAHALMKDKGIDIQKVICHAPYIINLANKSKPEAWEFSINFLKQELKRCEALGIKYIVLHPGSAVVHTREEAIENICDALNEVINIDTKVMIILETMAGKGTECGKDLNELKMILDKVIFKDKIGVCLDTCHLNDSGIAISNFDSYLENFDNVIGIDKIKCVHINDSLNPVGAHKDRHANIGYGTIGFENLINVIYNEKLKDVPKILETPYIGDYPPYKFEIESIKNKVFDQNLANRVEEYYKNL
ncbi:MAG: deoxyribonuclease IV [Firmicutes bacterium]|nr:deoxyribonuclease IV [Bacillota bacterium]